MYSASMPLQMLSPPTLDHVALFVVKTHQRQVDWLLYDSAALSCPPLPCHCLASPRNCQIVDGAQGCAVVCPHHSKRCSYSGSRFRILTWNLARCFSCQFIQLSKKRNSVFSQILICEFDFRFLHFANVQITVNCLSTKSLQGNYILM